MNGKCYDDDYNVDVGIDYKIQEWLSTGLNYHYKTKNSDSDWVLDDFGRANEYDDNQVVLYLKASY